MSSLQHERLRSKIDACVQRLECIWDAAADHRRLHPLVEPDSNSVEELRTLDVLRDLFVHWESGMGQSISDASWKRVKHEIDGIDRMRRLANKTGGGIMGAQKLEFDPSPTVYDFGGLDADQQHDLLLFHEHSSDDELFLQPAKKCLRLHLDPTSLAGFVDSVLFDL
jgi:hypothetical protein